MRALQWQAQGGNSSAHCYNCSISTLSNMIRYPSGADDIIWAKEQLQRIAGYKDAELLVSECNRKIAGM